MNITSQILQALNYLLLLVVLMLLWRQAFRSSEHRHLWSLFAWAWTMILLGNLAQMVHDLVTATPLNTFSFVDSFYGLRYVLIAWALWLYPASLSRQTWFWIGGTILAAIVIVWMIYFNPAMSLNGGDWTSFLGVALYPVLDAVMVTLAWLRFRAVQRSAWGRYALLLLCAMLSYGIANTSNLTEYVFSISGGVLQNVFWLLTHSCMLAVVLKSDLPKEKSNEE